MFRFDITFEFKDELENAAVRMWIDNAMIAHLDSEAEIPVARSGRCWTATFDHQLVGIGGCIWLRVAVAGRPGTSWKLEVRQHGIANPLIFSDGDVLTLPKEWLVATCYPQRRVRGRLPAVA